MCNLYLSVINPSHVFLLGLIIMLGASLWFHFNQKQDQNYTTATLVAVTTALSYATLYSRVMVVVQSDVIYYSRWLFYILSCSLLMYTIANYLKLKTEQLLPLLYFNGLVMLSGTLAAVLQGPIKWVIFCLGMFFFTLQLSVLYNKQKSTRKVKLVTTYIIFGWSLFPVVFLLAPEGLGLINNLAAACLYLVLDIFTKIIFYLHLTKVSKLKLW